ncbi:MAG: hypothetical protein R3F29_14220 [Planctomycetota bacterium]
MKLRGLLLLSSLSLVACAGQTYQADVGVMALRARGDVSLQNSAQQPLAPANSVKNQLDQGDGQYVPYLRLRTDSERHRIQLHGFGYNSKGTGQLTNDYGDLVAGTPVNTSSEFYAISANYGYEVLRTELYRVAVGAELGYYALDVAARRVSDGFRESVETSVLVPMPFVEGELFFDTLSIGANLGIMSADLGDANGRYWDFDSWARWQFDDRFDVMAGYRYLLLDGFGRASDRDFDADVDVQGIYLTAGIKF